MARNINDIQRDIDRNRRNLAQTLDEMIDRAKPTNVAGDVKTVMVAKLQDPEIQKIVAGVSAVVVGLVVLTMARSAKRRKELKELRQLLVARDS